MKKKLCIDARLYNNGSWAGRICTAMINYFVKENHLEYEKIFLYSNNKKTFKDIPVYWNIKKRVIPLPFFIYKFITLPLFLKKDSIDILISPTTDLPFWRWGNTYYISMIHDLFTEEIIDKKYGADRWFVRWVKHLLKTKNILETFYVLWLFKKCANMANKILAISNFSKWQAMKQYNIDEDIFQILPIAAENKFFEWWKEWQNLSLTKKYISSKKYIFTFDIIDWYENFADIVIKITESMNMDWIILNKNHSAFQSFSKTKAFWKAIFIQDFLSDEELAILIYWAEFIFFPTPWEWFGIPIVEAMALWKTVLAPNITAIPEVWWNLISLYEPNNKKDLEAKFLLMLNNKRPDFSELHNFSIKEYHWDTFSSNLQKIIIKEIHNSL